MAEAGGTLRTAGEGVGSLLAGLPLALVNFFSGVAAGDGVVDWPAMILGLLLSAIEGVRRQRIVRPMVSVAIHVALMGWAIA